MNNEKGLAQTQPLVSVMMIAYNSACYIEDAIQGVMGQKTNFAVQLVIGDDCSTDNTQEICERWAAEYPGKILLLKNEKNLGISRNYQNVWKHCTGKYIAPLDADDYWTDPDKLQKQVDFLEKHPDYAMCFHRVLCFYQESGEKRKSIPLAKETYTLEELSKMNFITHFSVVERKANCPELPDWTMDTNCGDYAFSLIQATKGKIRYFDKVMGVYRKHGDNAWANSHDMPKEDPVTIRERAIAYLEGQGGFSEAVESLKTACVNGYLSWLNYAGKSDERKKTPQEAAYVDKLLQHAQIGLQKYRQTWMEEEIYRQRMRLQANRQGVKNLLKDMLKTSYGYVTRCLPLPKPAGAR
ncbi:MAG: glycosyltransferase [Bacteroides sp.]|nr:glycosyltransferase [Bacteroides sp.]